MEILLNSMLDPSNQQKYLFENKNNENNCLQQMNGIVDVDECLLAHNPIPSSSFSSSSSNSSIDCCVSQIGGGNFGSEQIGAGNSWSRNAGRKKSHPVWTFFRDMRDSNGVGGVCCLHCEWAGDDRSPNNLRTHLKRFHEMDGVFKQFTQELAMTPTQPYVKRKRQQQQNGQQTNLQGQAQQPPTEQPIPMEQPAAHPVPAASQEGEKSQNVATPPPASAQPKKSPSSSPINPPPPDDVLANGIPHSGNQSAFSKYSTAALLQQAHPEGGKKSPAHGAEAPKSRPQTQSQSVGAPRSSYGLEAMTGLNGQQLSMLGLADPQLLVQLETAAAMSQLVQMQQPKGQQSQMQQNERALNELLALYAASAAAASALQQQQDGLKAKTMGAQNQQQQQLAAQQAAAAAWLYNWEWMAAAQRMGNGAQNGQTAGLANLLGQQQFGMVKGAFGTNGQKAANGNGNNAGEGTAALGMGMHGNGQQKTTKNGNGQQQQQTDAMLAKAAMSQLLIQAQQKQQSANAGTPKVEAAQQSQTQKRKSPTNEEGATNSPLQVLADTAASTAAVERRMQQSREETGGSPPKHARKEGGANQQQNQQQSTLTMGEREKALAESLVLYGMHRIAMELQLSYSVHANKGKAEYAFYCASGANGNANIQRMVTLTESADQILHIREYANGAVVAEECWPKSAEPYNLLSSLRDKCQRRLCAAQ